MRHLSTLVPTGRRKPHAQPEAVEPACCQLPVASTRKDAFRRTGKALANHPASAWAPIMSRFRSPPPTACVPPPHGSCPCCALRAPLTEAVSIPRTIVRVDVGMSCCIPRFRLLCSAISTRPHAVFARNDRPQDADALLAVRDRLRQCYLSASRHLVERLFALKLTGDTKTRDTLLAKAKALPYLNDRAKLAAILNRMNEADAWKLVVAPLLASEVDFVNQPPTLATLESDRVAELEIRADKKSVSGTNIEYEGSVRVNLNTQVISCDRVTLIKGKTRNRDLDGEGRVHTSGSSKQAEWTSADRFTYHAETRARSAATCSAIAASSQIAIVHHRDGDVLNARSWLDDFRNAHCSAKATARTSKPCTTTTTSRRVVCWRLERLNPHMSGVRLPPFQIAS